MSTEQGELYAQDVRLGEDHHHGSAPVRAALGAEGEIVSALALDPSFRQVALDDMLLLDTETTGLAGGTGTLAFVLGLAWFEAGRLRLFQMVLPRPGDEAPMLAFLTERLARASCLVTFNGKSFDWPLLRSRYVMNRMRAPEAKPHLDLLHCARRVFRRREAGARLVELEREVLGYHRIDDIPGAEISERYFRFLRTGQGELIAPVVEHNAQDLILLAALLGVLVDQFRASRAEDARDQLGYASVAARAGDPKRAMHFARAAAEAPNPALRCEALALIGDLARRQGDIQGAIGALERALQSQGPGRPLLHLQLAKLYEHRVRNPARALEHARNTLPAEALESHRRRLERLADKVEQSRLAPVGG